MESWLLTVISTVTLTVSKTICFQVQGSIPRQAAVRRDLSVSEADLLLTECPVPRSLDWRFSG
jgi:hypothetical protein